MLHQVQEATMSDIIERAEAALEGQWPGGRIISPARFFGNLVRELVAELKKTRRHIRYLELVISEEVGRLDENEKS
jgi:hypothetical protein